MSKQYKPMIIELSQEQANAIMVMLDAEMQTIFEEGIDPIADWELIHFHAYQLLAYQCFKEKYLETYDKRKFNRGAS